MLGTITLPDATFNELRWQHDFAIIHPGNCRCLSHNNVRDVTYADQQCAICDDEYGTNVPILIDEGRLWVHLSCYLEREVIS